ncbi:MAG: rod-binding protein [Spirochaetes bacterium]|nr:rod-binding protein [Spirochaetota bacterium]
MLAYQNQALRVPKAQPAQGLGAGSAAARGGASIDRSGKLYEQCREFESIFVNMMLKEMRGTVQKSGLIDGGQAEDIFSDMLYDEYAKGMTRNAGFGLADAVYVELSRQSSL